MTGLAQFAWVALAHGAEATVEVVADGRTAQAAFRAVSTYRARSLAIREYRRQVGEGPQGAIMQRTWTVYAGSDRLTVPTFLELAQSDEGARLAARLRRSRTASRAWGGLALAGALATAGTGVGLAGATDRTQGDWRLALSGSLAATVAGIAGSLVAHGRTHALTTDFPLTVRRDDAADHIERYNADLRHELGLRLAPDDGAGIEPVAATAPHHEGLRRALRVPGVE